MFCSSEDVASQQHATQIFFTIEIIKDHEPLVNCFASSSLTSVVQMFPTVIKTPHVGNFATQMDDDNCNSRDHAPSVCLDDLFQLCTLDSCFRWGGAAPIGVMTPFELSGPRGGPVVGPMCFKQRGCDDSNATDHHLDTVQPKVEKTGAETSLPSPFLEGTIKTP